MIKGECEHGNREHQCIYCETEELQKEIDNISLVYQDAIKIFRDNYLLEEALKEERHKNKRLSDAFSHVQEVTSKKSGRQPGGQVIAAIDYAKVIFDKFGTLGESSQNKGGRNEKV